MPFVMYTERRSRKLGQIEGLVKAIETVLNLRFPVALPSLMPRLLTIDDPDRVQQILEVALTASLAEIETAIEAAVPSPK